MRLKTDSGCHNSLVYAALWHSFPVLLQTKLAAAQHSAPGHFTCPTLDIFPSQNVYSKCARGAPNMSKSWRFTQRDETVTSTVHSFFFLYIFIYLVRVVIVQRAQATGISR